MHVRPQFNFDMRELADVRKLLGNWTRDIHLPLTLEMLWIPHATSATVQPVRVYCVVLPFALPGDVTHVSVASLACVLQQPVLVERWIMHYQALDRGALPTAAGDREELRQVYKDFAVLLRAVFSLTRVLPAHEVCRTPILSLFLCLGSGFLSSITSIHACGLYACVLEHSFYATPLPDYSFKCLFRTQGSCRHPVGIRLGTSAATSMTLEE